MSSVTHTVTHTVTPDELLRMPDGRLYELVDGELVEREMSTLSSLVNAELLGRLWSFVREHDLGWVFDSENGYQCFAARGDVRRPDVSFIAKDRLPRDEIGRGWTKVAPDLAIEVVSPNDVAEELEDKLGDYRAAGIPVVWVVYPEARIAQVRRGDTIEAISNDGELVGEGPLEGFRCTLAELLPR